MQTRLNLVFRPGSSWCRKALSLPGWNVKLDPAWLIDDTGLAAATAVLSAAALGSHHSLWVWFLCHARQVASRLSLTHYSHVCISDCTLHLSHSVCAVEVRACNCCWRAECMYTAQLAWAALLLCALDGSTGLAPTCHWMRPTSTSQPSGPVDQKRRRSGVQHTTSWTTGTLTSLPGCRRGPGRI